MQLLHDILTFITYVEINISIYVLSIIKHKNNKKFSHVQGLYLEFLSDIKSIHVYDVWNRKRSQ